MSQNKRVPSFRLTHSVVGLDILHDKICAIVMRYTKKRWAVDRTVKKEISPSLDTTMIAGKIKEVLSELDVKAKQIVTSLSSSDMIVKIMSLPPIRNPEEELPQLMEYELERQLPIPLSQAAYDYQLIRPPEQIDDAPQQQDKTTVLLAAVRRNRLDNHLALMESAGVPLKSVMPSFLMFLNALFASEMLPPDDPGFTGAIRLEANVVDVVVVEHGVLSFARSFAPKVETSYDFLHELRNTLRDFLPPTGKHKLEKLLIVTEDKSLPFHLTIERLVEALAFPHCEHKVMQDGFALGLAAGYLNIQQTLSLNLLKPLLKEQHTKEKMERRKRVLRFGPVGAMFALIAAAIILFNQTEIAQKNLTEAKEAQQIFEQKVNEKEDLDNLHSKLSRQIETLRWVDAGYPSLAYRLYQLAMSTPQNVWLKEVNTPTQPKRIKKEIPVMDSLIVTGYAPSQADIDDFIQQLRKCSCFLEVQQDNTEERTMNKQKVLLFQLSLKSEQGKINEQ
ncbi:pilus assembly protein PilM [bacterium]|nr:pilus assembly protein PilM [bacterium]